MNLLVLIDPATGSAFKALGVLFLVFVFPVWLIARVKIDAKKVRHQELLAALQAREEVSA